MRIPNAIGVLVAMLAAALPARARADDAPLTTRMIPLPPGMGHVVQGAPASNVLYLNRCAGDCIVSPGFDDARFDQSSIVSQPTVIAAYPWGDDSWQRVVSCVKTLYAAIDLEVTDQDPGMAPHFEAIVAGDPGDVGMPANVGGVSPFECGIIENAMTFTFAARLGDQPQRICEVIAQESAHAFGMDHVLDCQDPMTYLDGCGSKCFQDRDAPCGEDTERECFCSGDTQNSYAFLSTTFGTQESHPAPAITTPLAGSAVTPGFFVRVDGTVPCLRSIQAFVSSSSGGEELALGEIFQWPFVFNTPSELPTGPLTIRVVATDHGDASYEQSIEVDVEPAAAPDAGVPCGPCDDAGASAGNDGDGGGCGAAPHAAPLAWIGVALLIARRRSRRRAEPAQSSPRCNEP